MFQETEYSHTRKYVFPQSHFRKNEIIASETPAECGDIHQDYYGKWDGNHASLNCCTATEQGNVRRRDETRR
ncbi:hypothetical protein HHI36_019374, partial [Cryptolaemus montrouzieri]